MNKNLYLDLHVLQTVPPSCVNRDDTGSPKTAIYGGTMRARVSSQAWKKAMRDRFKEIFVSEQIGYRTKNVKRMLTKKIMMLEPEYEENKAEELAKEAIKNSEIKSGDDKKDVLFFISTQQIEGLAKLIIEYDKDEEVKKEKEKKYKDKWESVIKENPSVDMLLFGRMAANNPKLNFEAAVQVAHSISTHTVSNEYDYFTAVDDFGDDDNAGAGHLGTVEFNSSTLYRYATVNVAQLADTELNAENVGIAVRGFLEAFVCSMPTGKQNTFANRTLPALVYVALREDQPINMAGAFEKPVMAGNGGYEDGSIQALETYAKKVYYNYTEEPEKSWVVSLDKETFLNADRIKLGDLLEKIEKEIVEFAERRE